MYPTKKLLSIIAITTLISSSSMAEGFATENERNFYIGGGFGYSGPVKARFTDKDTQGVFSIKKSQMYSGFVGYKVTPDIMVELSAEYKPTYRFGIRLPQSVGGDYESTKAKSKVFMLSFVYNLKELGDFQPYFTVGAGLAQVEVKQVGVPVDLNVIAAGVRNMTVQQFIAGTRGGFPASKKFNTLKHTANCFAWQAGLGISKAVTENLSIDLGGKLQVAHNVAVRYQALDLSATLANASAGNFTPVYKTGKVKKTLGVGEATIGFTYALPF